MATLCRTTVNNMNKCVKCRLHIPNRWFLHSVTLVTVTPFRFHSSTSVTTTPFRFHSISANEGILSKCTSQYRSYSAKSHFHGILYSLFFLFEAFKRGITEMQHTEADNALSHAERAKLLSSQFNLFQHAFAMWSHMEREGYVLALHRRIQRETGNSNEEKQLGQHRWHLDDLKNRHAKETLQLERCQRALHELKKHAHGNMEKREHCLGEWSDELRTLSHMITDHGQWEELQLLPLLIKHFDMREISKIHYEAMQTLKQGSTNTRNTPDTEHQAPLESLDDVLVRYPFSKNNLQLCESMIREVISVIEREVEQVALHSSTTTGDHFFTESNEVNKHFGKRILMEMKKGIEPQLWSELKKRIPELTTDSYLQDDYNGKL